MRRCVSAALALVMTLALILGAAMSASALDDKYRFDDLGMTVKIPKNYYVITRDSSRDDEVFQTLSMDYDETITAFKAANIYLRAYDPDGVFQISLTVSSDDQSKSINNYSELDEAERKGILEVLTAESTVSAATEIKHGGNIFFDTSRSSEMDGTVIYINQCNTIINGLQIDLSMQKQEEEIVADEAKVLTNIASALEFDEIRYKNNGPSFEWWRLLLWLLILTVLAIGTSFIYKRRDAANHRRLEERRRQREAAADAPQGQEALRARRSEEDITFDEVLGYRDEDGFADRAATDLDQYDINVSDRDPMNGVSYFEDEGDSIDDRTDYFDTYFDEPTETQSGIMRMLSLIGAYIVIACRHIGYFFKNIWHTVTGKGKR